MSRKFVVLIVSSFYLIASPITALADPSKATSTYNQGLGPGPSGIVQLQEIVQRIINFIVPFAFILLTIILIVAGIKFLTSGGEAKPIAAAGQTITWALLGMLFLILSWLILMLIQAVTGVEVTKFCIGFPGAGTCPTT